MILLGPSSKAKFHRIAIPDMFNSTPEVELLMNDNNGLSFGFTRPGEIESKIKFYS